MVETIRTRFWSAGKHEYGYELGKANRSYYVKFLYPSAFWGYKEGNELKLYKTLKMAEKKISNFEQQHPPETLEEVRRKIAEFKAERKGNTMVTRKR
jgi:hypothetical protein